MNTYLYLIRFSVHFRYPDDRKNEIRSGEHRIEAPSIGVAELEFETLFLAGNESDFVSLPDIGWEDTQLEIDEVKDLNLNPVSEEDEQIDPLDHL